MIESGIGFSRVKVVARTGMKPEVPGKVARDMALNHHVGFSAL